MTLLRYCPKTPSLSARNFTAHVAQFQVRMTGSSSFEQDLISPALHLWIIPITRRIQESSFNLAIRVLLGFLFFCIALASTPTRRTCDSTEAFRLLPPDLPIVPQVLSRVAPEPISRHELLFWTDGVFTRLRHCVRLFGVAADEHDRRNACAGD